jgi:hypothetical protein
MVSLIASIEVTMTALRRVAAFGPPARTTQWPDGKEDSSNQLIQPKLMQMDNEATLIAKVCSQLILGAES